MRVEILCDPRPDFNTGGDRLVADGLSGRHEIRHVRGGDVDGFSVCLNRPGQSDLANSLQRAVDFWQQWARDLRLPAEHADVVERSALTLKGLQYQPSGAIIAAATTSLPECVGGSRNWDYRYSWLRDATLTLAALGKVGKDDEAQSWLDWLKMISLISGVEDLQTMYGIGGEGGPHRAGAAPSRRLQGLTAGSRRQRCRQAAPDRHLRGAGRRHLDGPHQLRGPTQPAPLEARPRARQPSHARVAEPDEGI